MCKNLKKSNKQEFDNDLLTIFKYYLCVGLWIIRKNIKIFKYNLFNFK